LIQRQRLETATPAWSPTISQPAHGAVVVNADGSYTYTPAANYNGTDSFTYRVTDADGGQSNIATVSLTITPVNDAPVAVDDAYVTGEDAALVVAAPGVLGNDSDVDGQALTASVITGPLHGNLTLNSDGTLTYTPATAYDGPDSFTYRASDGSLFSNTATVSLTVDSVNDPPVAVNDSGSTSEDTPRLSRRGLLTNDTDVDSATLTASVVAGPSHGSVVVSPDGSYTYTPAVNYNGADSFTYRASDGSLFSNTATVSLTVLPVADPPVAVADARSTNEDTVLNGTSVWATLTRMLARPCRRSSTRFGAAPPR
jgi:VCBS repeat-containing protein